MRDLSVMYSSKSDEWSTPDEIFYDLDSEFEFTLDPCATKDNAKCSMFYDKQDDGLSKNWGGSECFAIHLIQKLGNGLRRHFTKQEMITHLL